MANEDYAQKIKDALSNNPMGASSLENVAKSQAALAEKLSAVAIEAARRSSDLSAHWIQDALSKLSTVTQANTDPAEYAKVATDVVSGSAENLAAFAEIARKVQAETLAVLLSAGKDMSENATPKARNTTTKARNTTTKPAKG